MAQGTYKPTSHPNLKGESDSRKKHFSLRNGVEVIGGYSGNGNENNPNTKTILSGDISGDDDPNNIKVNKDDNVYHVFYHPDGVNLTSSAKLENVTITGGNANVDKNPHNKGGGMNNFNSKLALKRVAFTSNIARHGGGIYNDKSSPTLNNVGFAGNISIVGGGIYNNESSPILEDVIIIYNIAKEEGGGMFNSNNSKPELRIVTFHNNFAKNKGGGMANHRSSPILRGVVFTSNTAKFAGGGIYNQLESKVIFKEGCIFKGNIAGSTGDEKEGKGGAIYNFLASINGKATYGSGNNENKKVIKKDGSYVYARSDLEHYK